MIKEDSLDGAENNILYELLIYAEWLQEPEVQTKTTADRLEEVSDAGHIRKWLGPLVQQPCPPLLLRQLTNLQMPWTLAIGGNGAVIAILQDNCLEIRTSRDEYGAVIGRTQVSKDPYPQWRRILWSPDCTMLALAYSNGNVDFYDLIGAYMFTIESKEPAIGNGKPDFRLAAAGMAFCDVRIKNTQWSYEFLIADYQGILMGYYISPTDGYKESHTFTFSSCYPLGISCFIYHPTDNIIIVSGKSAKLSVATNTQDAMVPQMGLSAWRAVIGPPYYKLTLSLEEQRAYIKSKWWSSFSQHISYGSLKEDHLVFKMSISPNGKILAAVHLSGALSLWDLPSLRLKKYWPLQLQPNSTDVNPQYCEPGMKRRADFLQTNAFYSHIIDINWWSNEAVIIVRRCGAVTVSSINSLRNLLGISPEWFEPSPAVTSFCDRGFLAIESEVCIKSKRRAVEDADLDDDESSDEEEPSVFAYSYDLARKGLYFITDSDRFQPPRKKLKMVTKTYRLLCLKSTTPEELYTRKINLEEYGEALALAKTYNLDCDLVYQRQWRKMPATVESIHDYLSKITKRSWVLHECLERVPESFEAAKELLLYGLQGTDVKALIAIGKGEDHGRFILCSPYEDEDDHDASFDVSSSFGSPNLMEDDMYEVKKKLQNKKRDELLKQVNFKKLTLEQKQLCQCRLKLLTYLDRLMMYEMILGGPMLADEQFDHNFFKQFRSQCGLEAAIHFACNSNWEAVATLFTYNGSETLPHRLNILSNFPETVPPLEYQSLLPLFNEQELIFYPWDEHQLREPDWCETKYQRITNIPCSEDYVEEFYEKYKDLVKYREVSLSEVLVTEWFIRRAKEIEDRSGLVDNALELVRLGIQRNIRGLEKLFDDLTTLEVLIYDCLINKDLSLKEYQELTEFEKVQLLMSTTSEEDFVKHVEQWLFPFLERCDKHDPGCAKSLLKTYLMYLSKNSLIYCKKLLENYKFDTHTVISDVNELICLGLDCIYYCERSDQLTNAKSMHELFLSLPDQVSKNTPKQLHSVPNGIENLQKHISVCELLDRNGLAVTLAIVQNISCNSEEVKKILTKLTRMASHRFPVLSDDEWIGLLSDVLETQQLLFKCVSQEDCYEIVLQSLLCSGKCEGITLAGKMMECNNKQRREKLCIGPQSFKLPYAKSVQLVLAATREYFNSSANASDPCMALARMCLNLIEDVPASIEEELDLISAISLLQEFNVNVLPLQVRLCENRLTLVQEVLQKKDKNYKKSAKIMKLAYLLRAGSTNKHEREGKVLTLIGERAFQCKDYKECLSACKQLMAGVHKEGWMICYALGECNEFDDIPSRSDLLSFSLAYCSDDLMEAIMKSRTELQLQVLQGRVKYLMGDDVIHLPSSKSENFFSDELETDINGMNPLWHTGEKTFQILQNTTQTTKTVFKSVKSAQFWKDAVNWIQPLALTWEEKAADVVEDNNKSLSKQGICAFYDGLIENAHLSALEANYQRFARPDLSQSQEITLCITRAALLEDSLKFETAASSLETSILLDLAKACISEDIVFSLCILLCLKKPEDAETLFKKLPSVPLALQFASLYYAIRIYRDMGLTPFAEDNILETDPAAIIRKVLDMKNSKTTSEVNKKSWDLLEKYNKLLYDFIQAEILHSIGGGVDATRFTKDDVYKKDTILGISMTLDDNVFHTAVSLAHHYNIALWDLYMTHLEYLFSEMSVSASAITERIQKLKLKEKLLEHKKSFESRLRNCVYPNIDGRDHDKLHLYFSLLEDCGDHEDDMKLKPSLHKKLLNKLTGAMKGIDYKMVMSPESSCIYLTSIINESNVHVFAKVASSIPKETGVFYEPGNIYCLWVQKYFFEGKSQNPKMPVTKTDWIHRYESCTDMLQKLGPSDVLEWVDRIIFSPESLENMSIDCRSDIVKRILKFCRMKSSRHKGDFDLSSQWSDTAAILNQYHQHLQRLDDETLVQLRESYDPKIKDYCKAFDLTKSSTEKLKDLLARIVLEGPDLQLLKTFLSCCPSDISWEPADAYIKAINVILLQLKQPQNMVYSCFKTITPVHILEAILEDISKEKEELMIEDLAVEILNEFCQDADISVSTRLSILQLLEKTDCLSPEYGDLLLLYRTQAVVTSLWPNLEVSEEEVKDEFQRKVLFDTLLSMCRTVNHFIALAKLLSHWPAFSEHEDWACSDEPWAKLLCGLIALSNKDALNAAVSILEKTSVFPSFNEKCSQEVFRKIQEKGCILYTMKYALKTDYKALHDAALNILKDNPKITGDDYDDELLDLILKHNLTSRIISSGLYKPVIEFLLHCQDDSNIQGSYKSIDSIVKELHEAGYDSEAASILLIKNSTHTGLSTFSSAINVLHRWLSANKS